MSQKPLKIVYVIARFLPYQGGAEQNCWNMARRAAAQGAEVTVVTTTDSADGRMLAYSEEREGVKIVRMNNLFRGQLNLGFYPQLLTYLWSSDADIIHVCNGPGFIWRDLCLVVKKLKSGRKVKFITTPHGPFLATPTTHSGFKYQLARLGKLVMWPYLRLVWASLWDIVIAATPKQPVWMTGDYGIPNERIRLVPNGVNAETIISDLKEKEAITDAAPWLEALQDKPVISFLGRIAKYKGVQDVLQALRLVRDAGADFNFVIMGKLEYLEIPGLIRSLDLEDCVTLLERPDDKTRDAILTRSDIHILPSEWEATGIVLLEAMAKGNVVITTTGNEAAELIVDNGRNGFIYNYGDIERLKVILSQLLLGGNLVKQMQSASLAKAQDWTWEKAFEKYWEIISNYT